MEDQHSYDLFEARKMRADTVKWKRDYIRAEEQRRNNKFNFINLPCEMACEIFSYLLNVKDLSVCRMVCKNWNTIIITHVLPKVTKLTLTRCNIEDKTPFFKIANLEYKPKASMNFFIQTVEWPYFERDNYMKERQAKYNIISYLKYLEIETPSSGEYFSVFNTPCLEVFIYRNSNKNHGIKIDAPNLRELTYDESCPLNEDLLMLTYPESIRILKTNMYGNKILRFTGLESLMTKDIKTLDDAIEQHRYRQTLKKICYAEDIIGNQAEGGNLIENAKAIIRDLIERLKEYKCPEIEFQYGGFRFDLDETLIDKIKWSCFHNRKKLVYEIYEMNSHLLDPEAMSHLEGFWMYKNFMTNKLATKLTGITKLVTEHVEDENDLLEFIGNLKLLDSLQLEHRQSQEFYNKLPEKASKLIVLILQRQYDTNSWNLNLKFLERLPRLILLEFHVRITRETAKAGLEWLMLNGRKDFRFETDVEKFRITNLGRKFKVITTKTNFYFFGDVLGVLSIAFPMYRDCDDKKPPGQIEEDNRREEPEENYINLRTRRKLSRRRSVEILTQNLSKRIKNKT